MSVPAWSTACPDWEDRIIDGRSLIPFGPLFPAEASAARAVFDGLRVVDAPGRPTMGRSARPWLLEFVDAIFGAYDPDIGRRLITEFFLLIAKKNTKSTGAAGIMATALVRNWRDSGEFYVLAPTKEVADNSFFPARDMVQADPELSVLLHVQENIHRITHRNTGAFLKVVAADADTVGGKKTIALLVDELHLFGKRSGAASMLREAAGGLASRPEGFVIYLSTQSTDPPKGVFDEKLTYARDVRDGKVIDPHFLPVIYEMPRRLTAGMTQERRLELLQDPRYFHIPNPNLGLSVDPDYLTRELSKAKRAGQASLVDFLAKHLNVQVGQSFRTDGWAGAEVWHRGVDEELSSLDELLARCETATIGVDGGGLDDLLGEGVIGREKETKRWLSWGHALISIEGLKRRKANAEEYAKFKRAGDLTVFAFSADALNDPELKDFPPELLEGVLIKKPDDARAPDVQHVVDLVLKIKALGLLAQVGVDAAGIGAIVDALADIGVSQDAETLDAVRQGIALMGAIKTIERKVADGSFKHGGSPLLSWCVGNLKVMATPTAMRVARDEAGFGKIDPMMALFNAAHLMSLNPEASGRGIFEFYREVAQTSAPQQVATGSAMVRLRATSGISNVYGMSGRQYVVGADRIVQVTDEDAKPLIAQGFEQLTALVN